MWIQNVRNERINDSGSAGESLIVPAPQQLHILPGRTLPLRMVQQLLRMISDQHFITAGLVESSPERLHRIFRRIFQGDQCCSSLPAEAEDQAGVDQLNLAFQDRSEERRVGKECGERVGRGRSRSERADTKKVVARWSDGA